MPTIPEAVYGKLQKYPQELVFQFGSRMTDPNYYFIFFSIPTDASFRGTIAIAKNCAGEAAALWRLKIFSTFVVGLGLLRDSGRDFINPQYQTVNFWNGTARDCGFA